MSKEILETISTTTEQKTKKYNHTENCNHVYNGDICILCGHIHKKNGKKIHGYSVCEDCVDYVCSGEYIKEQYDRKGRPGKNSIRK